VALGHDGAWKLADFSHSTELPVSLAEWRDQCAGVQAHDTPDRVPPETLGAGTTMLELEMDVWLLGYFLAGLFFHGSAKGNVASGIERNSLVLAAAPISLLEPTLAKLWLFLHWLLAAEPGERPKANEAAALVCTLYDESPCEFLGEMPPYIERHCRSAATAAARQLAIDDALALAADPAEHDRLARRLTDLSLGQLCGELADPSRVHRLCHYCGLELGVRPGDPDGHGVPRGCARAEGPGRTDVPASRARDRVDALVAGCHDGAGWGSELPSGGGASGFFSDFSRTPGPGAGGHGSVAPPPAAAGLPQQDKGSHAGATPDKGQGAADGSTDAGSTSSDSSGSTCQNLSPPGGSTGGHPGDGSLFGSTPDGGGAWSESQYEGNPFGCESPFVSGP